MSAYCTISDVYRWIPRGSAQNPALVIGTVNAAADVMVLEGHGFELDDELLFRAASGGSLPDPLLEGVTYYAIPVTESTLQAAATAGGAAIDLTTAGENVVAIGQLPWAAWIEEASNELECTLPAHAVPLAAPYPAIVRAYCAGLVAEKVLAQAGVQSEGLTRRLENTRRELAAWRRGVPLRGDVVPTASNVAVSSSATAADARRWAARGDRWIP